MNSEDEVVALIATLHETERRLVELTGGEVDTVTTGTGQPFLLRRAQVELRSSEAAKQVAILNALPAHIALLDAQGRIVSVNETWRRFASANSFQGADLGVGLNYLDVCDRARGDDSVDAHRAAAGIRTVLAGAKNFSLEYPCHSPTERRWFQLMVTPLAEDRAGGAVVMHLNISERRRAEHAMRESEAAMTAAQQIGHFGSWEVTLHKADDDDANTLRWSDEMFRIAGYEPGAVEVTNRFFFNLVPPEEHEPIRQAVAAAIREHTQYAIVHRLIRADGEMRVVQETAKIFYDDKTGRPLKIIGTAHDITDRTRADDALRESNEKFHQLADNITDAFWIRSPDMSEVQYVSPAFERIWGRTVKSLQASPHEWSEFIFAADRARVLAAFAALSRDAPSLDIEYRIVRPDAEIRWVRVRGFQVRNATDQLIRHIGIVTDITERKQIEAARFASEERFRSYFELGLIGMAITSPTKGFLEVNYELCRILGYGREELFAKKWVELTHPDDLAAENVKFGRVLAGEMDGYSMEKRFLRKDGAVVHAMIAVKAARREDGTIDHIVGLLQDITERKQSEAALRASEQRFKALFEQAAVGVTQGDAVTGRFVQVNQRFSEIVGYSRQELESLTFAAITHPHDVASSLDVARRIMAGEIREFTSEKRYVRKDRSEVWVNLTVSAMWAPGETPDYFIAIAQDITGRKQLEEQFRQAQKMEAIGTLAGGIAHDFNNILAAINGYTELCLMTLKENPNVREHLQAVLRAGGRATDLVRQILTFSRQQPQERRPIPLRPVVAECIALLRATIPTTIEFDTSLATDAPIVLADASQVHQILMNLGTNAWYAMKDRTGRLHIELERYVVDAADAVRQPRLRPGLYARVSLRDTGCGMDAATLHRIFEPFFTTKPPGAGTGLGLAVVHGIMDNHDGAITVQSEPGVGTAFDVYFPAYVGATAVAEAEKGQAPRGHGERLLVVDDEEVIARLMKKELTALGYEVESASEPTAALARVRADPGRFVLVITDQTMPGMTGLQLATTLSEIRPGLPIIIMTGYSLTLTPERVKAAGACPLLLKPFTFLALGTAVHAALATPPPL